MCYKANMSKTKTNEPPTKNGLSPVIWAAGVIAFVLFTLYVFTP